MRPDPTTGTQGKEGYQEHVIVVPSPLVGRSGSSEESGSSTRKSDHRSTTMVRLPGNSGDSGFRCESLSEDVKIITKSMMEGSKSKESPKTRESEISQFIRASGGDLVARK